MNKNMVETMQNDMHLFPYRDESISNYLGRLVYSALSYWIRTCIMDRTSESNDTKSKAYILGRGKEVLWGFVECIPECKQWISSTDKEIEDRIAEMVIDIVLCFIVKIVPVIGWVWKIRGKYARFVDKKVSNISI